MALLVLSASVGGGHVRAAEALAEAAGDVGPRPEVVHWDVLEFTSALYRRAYRDGYAELVERNPALWGYLYATFDRARAGREQAGVVQMFDRLQFARFRAELRALAPAAVIATHFLPCQVLAPCRRRGRDAFPLGLVLTDFDAHALWVQPTADRFFVGSDELRAVLAGKGIAPERIAATGIPIGRAFGRRPARARIRERLGLAPAARVVLTMGGGRGAGPVEDAVAAALEVDGTAVLAVAGRNARLEKRLHGLGARHGDRLRVFGFVRGIAELMAAADLIVTKSGGLTSAECLAVGLPMLVRDPTPGQEERNCDHLLEAGAAWKTHGPHSLRYKLRALLADGSRLRAMRRAARRAARPDAAGAIVRAMLGVAADPGSGPR